ncbi:MAG: hypothetical protein Q9165_005729 [Trypethelium subeluteriae]
MQDAAPREEDAVAQESTAAVDLPKHDALPIISNVMMPERGAMARPRRPATLSKKSLVAERQQSASMREGPLTTGSIPKSPSRLPLGGEMENGDAGIVKSQQAQIKRLEEEIERQRGKIEKQREEINHQKKDIEAVKMAFFRANDDRAEAVRHAIETSSALHQRDKAELKRHAMFLGHRDKIREPRLDSKAPGGVDKREFGKFLYSGARDRIREMKVKLLILQATLAHQNGIHEEVIDYAKGAEKAAAELGYEPLSQRCRYWQAVGMIGRLLLDPSGGVNQYRRSDVDSLLESCSSCYKQYPEGLYARDLLNGRTSHRMHWSG